MRRTRPPAPRTRAGARPSWPWSPWSARMDWVEDLGLPKPAGARRTTPVDRGPSFGRGGGRSFGVRVPSLGTSVTTGARDPPGAPESDVSLPCQRWARAAPATSSGGRLVAASRLGEAPADPGLTLFAGRTRGRGLPSGLLGSDDLDRRMKAGHVSSKGRPIRLATRRLGRGGRVGGQRMGGPVPAGIARSGSRRLVSRVATGRPTSRRDSPGLARPRDGGRSSPRAGRRAAVGTGGSSGIVERPIPSIRLGRLSVSRRRRSFELCSSQTGGENRKKCSAEKIV